MRNDGFQSDRSLVQRAQVDKAAFAQLYRNHVTSVYRFLYARVGNPDDAQDLTSQTFMGAMEKLSTFRNDSSFRTWLLGIARNKALHHLRQTRRTAPLESLEQLPAQSEPIADTVSNQLHVEQVLSQLRILSADRAEAILLRFFGELSMAEIAQIMGKSEASVKMLVHRGLKDLHARREEYQT
ncbi:MAG: RNA polymerase sigma factor [Chloroflexota bacterium]